VRSRGPSYSSAIVARAACSGPIHSPDRCPFRARSLSNRDPLTSDAMQRKMSGSMLGNPATLLSEISEHGTFGALVYYPRLEAIVGMRHSSATLTRSVVAAQVRPARRSETEERERVPESTVIRRVGYKFPIDEIGSRARVAISDRRLEPLRRLAPWILRSRTNRARRFWLVRMPASSRSAARRGRP
jgi:hypothetical protein